MSDKKIDQQATVSPLSKFRGLNQGTLQLTFKEGISAKEVHLALDRAFELCGCPGCGFLGFDFRFGIDSAVIDKVRDLEGVVNAHIFSH
jgi:hypothetical protein